MPTATTTEIEHTFTVSREIFEHPNLDIYTQMVCIVLRCYTSEATLPTLSEIARQGRMTSKQATTALQSLVETKILPHKIFRQIVGEFADDRLSWSAKGMLAYCKKNSQISLHELVELSSQSGDDEHSVRKCIRELHHYGYLEEFPELLKLVH